MQLFTAILLVVSSTVTFLEMRKAPRFIVRIVILIIVEGNSLFIVQTGFVLDLFNGEITHFFGVFIFCLQIFLDIVIYWVFAISYWETAININSYLKRISTNEEEKEEYYVSK